METQTQVSTDPIASMASVYEALKWEQEISRKAEREALVAKLAQVSRAEIEAWLPADIRQALAVGDPVHTSPRGESAITFRYPLEYKGKAGAIDWRMSPDGSGPIDLSFGKYQGIDASLRADVRDPVRRDRFEPIEPRSIKAADTYSLSLLFYKLLEMISLASAHQLAEERAASLNRIFSLDNPEEMRAAWLAWGERFEADSQDVKRYAQYMRQAERIQRERAEHAREFQIRQAEEAREAAEYAQRKAEIEALASAIWHPFTVWRLDYVSEHADFDGEHYSASMYVLEPEPGALSGAYKRIERGEISLARPYNRILLTECRAENPNDEIASAVCWRDWSHGVYIVYPPDVPHPAKPMDQD